MRRLLKLVLFLVVSILLVWILKQTFPKNTGALNYFLIFLFLDAFLWAITWREIRNLKRVWRYLLTILFWMPFCLVVAGVIYGFFSTYYFWPRFVKTYLTSVVFIAYATRILPIAFLVLTFIYQGILWVLARFIPKLKIATRKSGKLFVAGWLLGISLFLLMLAGMVLWEHHYKVRTTEITLGKLPPSFDGLRIVQLSDIHLGSWNRISKLSEMVDLVNELDPDLIFFTGDLCNYSTAEVWPFQDVLRKLKARYGIYTVLGNHDYGAYMTWISEEAKRENMLELYRFYDELGWKLLRNENDLLVLHDDTLAIVGVENWGSIGRFQRLADMPKAMTGTQNISTKLLLSHDPTHWDSIVSKQYPEIDITFSGHTHGGQVGLETSGWQWSFVQYLYPEWAGLYQKRWEDGTEQYLYVNRGAGTIGYAGRVGIWAEITLIVLKSNKN
ncbi:MAG: metallophosphoesterase [Bacteroidales bacterium]|nr:metallophosphoesterase [Bacteroidales bacterium]